MSLFVSKVPRSLETKAKLFGFELGDLLLVFLYLSLSNLIFGGTRFKFPIVWLGTLVIAGVLYFVKKDKPDGYLQHWGENLFSPEIYSASAPDIDFLAYQKNKEIS